MTSDCSQHPVVPPRVIAIATEQVPQARNPFPPRIHQALKHANWDLKKMIAPTDLGVPAFNLGNARFRTQDFNNGLGLMINGVQQRLRDSDTLPP